MRAAARCAALLLLVIGLSGCAELFEFNLFEGLDPVRLPDAVSLADLEAGGGPDAVLDYLGPELASPSFCEKLREDPASAAAVEAWLNDRRGTASSAEEARATVLYGELRLKLTGGFELVNNAFAFLLTEGLDASTFADDASFAAFLADLLPEVVPAEALASSGAFDRMIAGFRDARGAYALLAGGGQAGSTPEINPGGTAQCALLADIVVQAADAYGNGALLDLALGVPSVLASGASFANPLSSTSELYPLFQAAGLEETDFQP